MKRDDPGHRDSNIFISVLRDIFGWFANLLGFCLIAGGVGTAAGLYLGLPFTWALGVGVLAIVLLLAIWLFLMSESGFF